MFWKRVNEQVHVGALTQSESFDIVLGEAP